MKDRFYLLSTRDYRHRHFTEIYKEYFSKPSLKPVSNYMIRVYD